jgi:hypothetical protein
VTDFLFPVRPPDAKDLPNRIRSAKEVGSLCVGAELREWLNSYVARPTVEKHFRFFELFFVAFVVFTSVGTYWSVHSLLIGPALALSPTVRGW